MWLSVNWRKTQERPRLRFRVGLAVRTIFPFSHWPRFPLCLARIYPSLATNVQLLRIANKMLYNRLREHRNVQLVGCLADVFHRAVFV